MDVRLEDVTAELANKGILLRISKPNGGGSVGRLRIGRAKLEWYPGKTSKNATTIWMEDFIEWLDSHKS
jgi:hypothetical protein